MRNSSGPISTITAISESRPSLRALTAADWALVLSALALALVGLATVQSATAELGSGYLPRQVMWVAVGIALLLLAASLDYHSLLDLAPWAYGLSLVLLVAVYTFGHEAGGARSRLVLGSFSFQPSELAKLATALLLAHFLARANERYLSSVQLLWAGAVMAAPMAPIALEPDLGSAAMFVPMTAGMVWIAGVRPRTLVVTVLLALAVGSAVWTFGMKDYQRQRVLTFVSPGADPLGAGYQVRQSKIAVGSGGLAGKGYMQGTQSQLRFLPARHTDFVFAVLAEEWGFVGVLLVFGLYGTFLGSAVRIAVRARDRAGIFLVVGLVSLLGFHALYNSAMVIGLVPITGIPLPFLSYGGTFTLMCFLATGLVLGVDIRRYVNR